MKKKFILEGHPLTYSGTALETTWSRAQQAHLDAALSLADQVDFQELIHDQFDLTIEFSESLIEGSVVPLLEFVLDLLKGTVYADHCRISKLTVKRKKKYPLQTIITLEIHDEEKDGSKRAILTQGRS